MYYPARWTIRSTSASGHLVPINCVPKWFANSTIPTVHVGNDSIFHKAVSVDSHFMSRIEVKPIKIQFSCVQEKEGLNKDILK